MDATEIDWLHVRNAIRKRIKTAAAVGRIHPQDIDDKTQDACGLALIELRRGTDTGLAVWRAAAAVLPSEDRRGRTLAYEPANRERWEETIDPVRVELMGSSQATRRAARGLPLSGRTDLE